MSVTTSAILRNVPATNMSTLFLRLQLHSLTCLIPLYPSLPQHYAHMHSPNNSRTHHCIPRWTCGYCNNKFNNWEECLAHEETCAAENHSGRFHLKAMCCCCISGYAVNDDRETYLLATGRMECFSPISMCYVRKHFVEVERVMWRLVTLEVRRSSMRIKSLVWGVRFVEAQATWTAAKAMLPLKYQPHLSGCCRYAAFSLWGVQCNSSRDVAYIQFTHRLGQEVWSDLKVIGRRKSHQYREGTRSRCRYLTQVQSDLWKPSYKREQGYKWHSLSF